MDITLLQQTWNYVSGAPSFWSGVGFLTASAMLVGGILYNGDVPKARKGSISFLIYIGFLMWIELARKTNDVTSHAISYPEKVYASTLVLLITTACYIVGMYLGVLIVGINIRRTHK